MSAGPAPMCATRLPDMTVVIISIVGGASLEACRAALQKQGVAVEVFGEADDPVEGAKLPVPLQRLRAVTRAKTPYVALIEDTAAPDPDWCETACEALRAGASAVGGPVVISPLLPARFRALGLCEYGRFTADAAAPEAVAPGLALAVERAACLPLTENSTLGLVEADLCSALWRAGRTVAYLPGLRVTYAHKHPQGAQLRTRRLHGRLYGSTRVSGRPWWARLGRAMSALALPALLTLRTLRRSEDHRRPPPRVVLWVVAMQTAWAWGEFVGYLTGTPGESLESWI